MIGENIHLFVGKIKDLIKEIHNLLKLNVDVGEDFPELREVVLQELLESEVLSFFELVDSSFDGRLLDMFRHVNLIKLVVEARKVGEEITHVLVETCNFSNLLLVGEAGIIDHHLLGKIENSANDLNTVFN